VKDFIVAALRSFEQKQTQAGLRGLIFALPIATNLFEGLGEKDEFVKACAQAFHEDEEGRKSFRD
jgi:hypothetical protein